jgi:uncharacterized protein
MSSTWCDLIDPRRAADTGAVAVGRVPLSELRRLAPLLLDATGEADYRIEFSRDAARRAVLRGEVRARLTLRCQRCLGPMEHQVTATLSLAVVAGLDEAEGLPEGYDPLLLTEGRIRLCDLIEDELLLGLPQIPRHASDICANPPVAQSAEPPPEHPFAVLAHWRGKH